MISDHILPQDHENTQDKMYYSTHSPRGANASFALGARNEGGGFMHNEAGLTQNDVYIGICDGKVLKCLPFFPQEDSPDGEEAFDFQAAPRRNKVLLHKYKENEFTRELCMSTDRWKTADFTFEIMTPVDGICDPEATDAEEVKYSVLPAIAARFTVQNTRSEPIVGYFSVMGLRGVYSLGQTRMGNLIGAAGADGYGFAMDAKKYAGKVQPIADLGAVNVFNRKSYTFYQNASMGGFVFDVQPGETYTVEFALGWHHAGMATRGALTMPYYYTRYFANLEEVLAYAVAQYPRMAAEAKVHDEKLAAMPISDIRKFMVAQSVHCYWASTMLFDHAGRPRYVVNEGSYMMMNTFDLSVDHLFYECERMPWSVKNQLDYFADEYSYRDTVHLFGGDGTSYPGGISFTHDQGCMNTFSPLGYSSYEMKDKEGCLSYMTMEQLTNWVISAAMYVGASGDKAWVETRRGIIADCLTSMQNRDNPDPAKRDGVMSYDSDRCGEMYEITTYDSLDASLGQSRRNLYVAGKSWASYLGIATMLQGQGGIWETVAQDAMAAAKLCAQTMTLAFDESLGFIPALLDGKDQSPIIPAIECLAYPYFFGKKEYAREDGPFGDFVKALKRHFDGVYQYGRCRFPDGGWRLSANSINSWMSKINLCMFVAENILKADICGDIAKAEEAHAHWWQVHTAGCPGIDQIFWGNPFGRGFHYPRAVTAILFTMK